MDGAATLQALAADPAHAGIPMIIMNSLPEEAVTERSGSRYAAYLRKPFRLKAILEKIKKLLADTA